MIDALSSLLILFERERRGGPSSFFLLLFSATHLHLWWWSGFDSGKCWFLYLRLLRLMIPGEEVSLATPSPAKVFSGGGFRLRFQTDLGDL